MSSIEIVRAFTMPRDQLRGELSKLSEQLAGELQLDCEWLDDDCLNFRRSGVEGQINIGDEEIELTVKLGMLMELFRTTIEREVLAFIDEHIY